MPTIKNIVESPWFNKLIISVIILNGAILGAQTSRSLSTQTSDLLENADGVCLIIFVIELALKLFVYRTAFFKEGWNIFDLLIILVALIPTSGSLSILRAFRILRVLRLITAIKSFRRVVTGMLLAIPGVGAVAGLLLMVFYIGAVLSTTLFGDAFPQWFGTLGKSMYSLFQIMTLESWSMGIVRPVMEVQPYAWLFFIPFITVSTFTVLNLFIGIVVDAMSSVKDSEKPALVDRSSNIEVILLDVQKQLASLREEVRKSDRLGVDADGNQVKERST